MVGVGVYGVAGAVANDKTFSWLTAEMRVGFVAVVFATGKVGALLSMRS